MSSIKISTRFSRSLTRMARAVEGMAEAMSEAEAEAKGTYRWRRPGEYQRPDKNGRPISWEVTGLTADSITGYVVSPRVSPRQLPGGSRPAMRFLDNSDLSKTNRLDPSITGTYGPEKGKIRGILTMYSEHSPYLQEKEIQGGLWGIPGAGEPVVVEVVRVNGSRYARLLRRAIRKRLGV